MIKINKAEVYGRVVDFIEMMPEQSFIDAFEADKIFGVNADLNIKEILRKQTVSVQMGIEFRIVDGSTTKYKSDHVSRIRYHATGVLGANGRAIAIGVTVSSSLFYTGKAGTKEEFAAMISKESKSDKPQMNYFGPALSYLSLIIANVSSSFLSEPLLLDLSPTSD